MANSYFRFKQFTIQQERCAMKVTTDACLFGAWAAAQIAKHSSPAHRLLDIGTGTGLLSLMIAQQTNCPIDAIEIDTGAFEQARENSKASPWHARINTIHGDIKSFRSSQDYDHIVSNPPFYENELTSQHHQKNMAHHHAGLLLMELLKVIKSALSPEGRFYLLLPYKRNAVIPGLLKNAGLQAIHIMQVKQSARHDFFRIMLCGGHEQAHAIAAHVEEMSIADDAGGYTDEFKYLLKDYYLRDW